MKPAITILATLAFCLTPFCANAAPPAKRSCCQSETPDNMAGMRCCCNDTTKAQSPTATASLPTAAQMAAALPVEVSAPVLTRQATVAQPHPVETGSPPYLVNCQIIC